MQAKTKYCNGFDQRVAKQRLRKHVPTNVPRKNTEQVSFVWSAPRKIMISVFSERSVPCAASPADKILVGYVLVQSQDQRNRK